MTASPVCTLRFGYVYLYRQNIKSSSRRTLVGGMPTSCRSVDISNSDTGACVRTPKYTDAVLIYLRYGHTTLGKHSGIATRVLREEDMEMWLEIVEWWERRP
jgi:hypothetical protein